MNVKRLGISLGSLLIFIYVPAAMMAGMLSLQLLRIAETGTSKVVAAAVLLLLPLPLILYFSLFVSLSRRVWRICGLLFLTAIIGLTLAWAFTPDGTALPDSPLQSVYYSPAGYRRSSPANLVPEIDQFKLGSYLLTRVDPVIDQAQSERVRDLFLQVYREMRGSDDFNRVGSSMNYAYQNMLLGTPPAKHYYLYFPRHLKGKEVPLLVFLHGSGGNFKGYMWLLGKFAEEHGVAVLAPDFGFGHWDRKGGVKRVEEVMDLVESSDEFKISGRMLIGLSNGGHGVLHAGAALADRFDAGVMISPIMTTPGLTTYSFARRWGKRPLLVVHGSEDRRIPASYIEKTCAELRSFGVPLQLTMIPDEDHFLMFSQWPTVANHLAGWLEKLPSTPSTPRRE